MVQLAQMSKENYITKAGIKNLQQMQVYVAYATPTEKEQFHIDRLTATRNMDYLIIQVRRQITFTQ